MTDRMGRPTRRERDLRQYSRTTQFRLVLGALFILFVVGTGLIWWVYGPQAARLAILCLLAGLAPVLLIVAWLWILDWILRKSHHE